MSRRSVCLFDRALLQKRPIIIRSLLIVVTPCMSLESLERVCLEGASLEYCNDTRYFCSVCTYTLTREYVTHVITVSQESVSLISVIRVLESHAPFLECMYIHSHERVCHACHHSFSGECVSNKRHSSTVMTRAISVVYVHTLS